MNSTSAIDVVGIVYVNVMCNVSNISMEVYVFYCTADPHGIQSSKTTGEPPLVLANPVFFTINQVVGEA